MSTSDTAVKEHNLCHAVCKTTFSAYLNAPLLFICHGTVKKTIETHWTVIESQFSSIMHSIMGVLRGNTFSFPHEFDSKADDSTRVPDCRFCFQRP